jgi:hypothetical protein
MKKLVFSTLVAALAFASAPAFAAQPDGSTIGNSNAKSQGSAVGQASSQIIQNGQFVSGTSGSAVSYDCQTPACGMAPGTRAAEVHSLLGQ